MSKRCPPARSIWRCSWKATAWATCCRGHPGQARQAARRCPEREAAGRQPALRPGRICALPMACCRSATPIATPPSARWRTSTPRRSPTCASGLPSITAPTTSCWCCRAISMPPPRARRWKSGSAQIPRGPAVAPVEAGPVTLARPESRDMTDQVPVLRLTRNWTGPGVNDPETPALADRHATSWAALPARGSTTALVRGTQAGGQRHRQRRGLPAGVSFLQATMDVKPGVERAVAEAAFDKVLADFIAEGPTEDEVRRAVVSTMSSRDRRAGTGRRLLRQGRNPGRGRGLFRRSGEVQKGPRSDGRADP